MWKRDRVTKHELPAYIAEGERIFAAMRADCVKLKSEKARLDLQLAKLEPELAPKRLEVQALQKERDREIHYSQLLAGFLRARGGYSIDALPRDISEHFVAGLRKQKEGPQLSESAYTGIKAELANSLRATLTRSVKA